MEAATQQYVITFAYFNRSPEKKVKSTMVMHFLLNIDIKCDSSRDIDRLILRAVSTFENQAIVRFRVRHLFSIAFSSLGPIAITCCPSSVVCRL